MQTTEKELRESRKALRGGRQVLLRYVPESGIRMTYSGTAYDLGGGRVWLSLDARSIHAGTHYSAEQADAFKLEAKGDSNIISYISIGYIGKTTILPIFNNDKSTKDMRGGRADVIIMPQEKYLGLVW